MSINFTEMNKKTQYPSVHTLEVLQLDQLAYYYCRKLVYIYFEKHTILINILCGENTAILMVKFCGSYSYHGNLKNEGKYKGLEIGDSEYMNGVS